MNENDLLKSTPEELAAAELELGGGEGIELLNLNEPQAPVTMSASDLIRNAGSTGLVGTRAATTLEKYTRHAIGQELGQLPTIDANHVTLIAVVVDDSGSLQGHESDLAFALNALRESLTQEETSADIFVAITRLNRGVLQNYCRPEDLRIFSGGDIYCDDGTPLFGRSLAVFAEQTANAALIQEQGRQCRTITLMFTDGEPTDGKELHGETRTVVEGLVGKTQHIIAGIGVGDVNNEFWSSVAMPNNWILSVNNMGALREAFGRFSRSAASASQGARAFESVKNTGFGN